MVKKSIGLASCRIVDLPKIFDSRGNLTFIEEEKHIPFGIKRVYYVYDVPGGQWRGGHAHKKQEEFIIAANGSFDVILDDGFNKKRIHLNRSYYGLYVPTLIWRELDNFSTGSICLVLASDFYAENDYWRNYDAYKKIMTAEPRREEDLPVKRICGKTVDLRLVSEEDAKYILEIRTSGEAKKFISRTENNVDKQIQWIKDYKIRESEKKEYYFIIESKKCEKYGAIRLYDMRDDSFSWGSWVVETGSPIYASIESVLLIYRFGFYKLDFTKCHFEVRKANLRVKEFHLRFGARIAGEDELNLYFQIDKDAFEKSQEKYKKYLPENNSDITRC